MEHSLWGEMWWVYSWCRPNAARHSIHKKRNLEWMTCLGKNSLLEEVRPRYFHLKNRVLLSSNSKAARRCSISSGVKRGGFLAAEDLMQFAILYIRRRANVGRRGIHFPQMQELVRCAKPCLEYSVLMLNVLKAARTCKFSGERRWVFSSHRHDVVRYSVYTTRNKVGRRGTHFLQVQELLRCTKPVTMWNRPHFNAKHDKKKYCNGKELLRKKKEGDLDISNLGKGGIGATIRSNAKMARRWSITPRDKLRWDFSFHTPEIGEWQMWRYRGMLHHCPQIMFQLDFEKHISIGPFPKWRVYLNNIFH